MELYLKLHPNHIAWLVDNEMYGIINLSSNLIENGHRIKEKFTEHVQITPEAIIIEKPFLKLLGDNQRTIADSIIHVQRNFGMLLYILDEKYGVPVNHVSSKVARTTVYKREYITKDVQLSEACVLLKGLKTRQYTPLNILSLHDVMVLKAYWGRIKNE